MFGRTDRTGRGKGRPGATGGLRLPFWLACCLTLPAGAPPAGPAVPIGLFVSTREPEGREVLRGAELALLEANRRAAGRFRLVLASTDLPWGLQSRELVRLIYDAGVAAIVGALDRPSAHLALQVITRSKGQALLLTLADDPSLTESGIPWVFRMVPKRGTGPGVRARLPAGSRLCSFAGSYRERYGRPPTVLAAYAFDAVLVLTRAISWAGPEAGALRRHLMQIPVGGVSGRIRFEARGERRQSAPWTVGASLADVLAPVCPEAGRSLQKSQ